jgi:hypothetical protein
VSNRIPESATAAHRAPDRAWGANRRSPSLACKLAALALLAAIGTRAAAQETSSLAKDAKNPFADLVNLQLFYDANLAVSPANNTQQVLTLQPLVPVHLDKDWIIITRTILPLIDQPGAAPGQDWVRGAGDTQFAALLSPARVGSLDWGIGPVFQLPTASNSALGQGKWGAGPAAGVQWTGTQWTVGLVALNIWSFAGSGSRPAVNQLQLQPSVNYTFKDNPNRYLSFGPTITADWTASASQRWTVPVSLGIGQLMKLGHQSVNIQTTAYYNVVAPSGASQWTLELLVQFLFPENK